MYFSNYARSVTLIVRGPSLTRSMSHYLIEQLATRKNVHVRLGSEVTAVYGSDHLEALDVTVTAAADTTRLAAAALYIFIGADAETSWLPVAVERDERGYVVTGPDAARNWTLDATTRSVSARDERARNLCVRGRTLPID